MVYDRGIMRNKENKGGFIVGKATNDRGSQVSYIQNRIHMLQQVVETLDAESANVDDLSRVLTMLQDLEGKVERYKKDWEEGRS